MSADNADTPLGARRIIAICSPKGGSGASMMATNLAVFLAQIGKTVVLVDANMLDAQGSFEIALGLLMADLRRDFSTTRRLRLDPAGLEALDAL